MQIRILYRFTLLTSHWLRVTHSLNLHSHFQLSFQFLTLLSNLGWSYFYPLPWSLGKQALAPLPSLASEMLSLSLHRRHLGVSSCSASIPSIDVLSWELRQHPLLRRHPLGCLVLLPELIPYIGKAHLCLFGSIMFWKAVVFSQLCRHGFALLSLTLGPQTHPKCYKPRPLAPLFNRYW